MQDYHNQKIFGPPWSLVYLTATFYPPIGQLMTFKYDSINTIEQPSNHSGSTTDNHDDNHNLILSDWRPTVWESWQPTMQLSIEPLISPTIKSNTTAKSNTISV